MKALWVVLGVLGLIVLVAIFGVSSYYTVSNEGRRWSLKSANVDTADSPRYRRRSAAGGAWTRLPNLVASMKVRQ